MKQHHRIYILSTVLLILGITPAVCQELETIVPEKEFPQEYIEVTHNRAYDFVKEMDLSSEKIDRVTEIVAQQYRDLSAIQDTRDAKIEMIEEQFDEDDTIEQMTREIKIKAQLREDALHRQFIAKLTAEISAEQVNEVKNGMTYGVVPITFKGYLKLLPGLTEEQQTQIKAWLIEAREYAMDAGSSRQKHHIFNDYKGKINNYVSSLGYDLEEAEKRLQERQQKSE
ncbi:DUF3826 domain-containing protein [Aliifodinibius sp. S!AR15-10]|uniref:DUF3826 domain-containing protein n=1 Tax=Aliifodinibius sp. S!AR15-10 TaxID=2950437 RepID=UPI0028639E25|nr:DUF3826 domain-containing protein [Aliifodinibius sp. S!AR15-10]MDR8391927.1 DUF3826 domain-containing protein [Aliifodinibius sp. S!AR15-10]